MNILKWIFLLEKTKKKIAKIGVATFQNRVNSDRGISDIPFFILYKETNILKDFSP